MRGVCESGEYAWSVIVAAVGPSVGTNKKVIVATACVIFRVDERDRNGNLRWPAGESKLKEAARKRCGWKTAKAIEKRARDLNLLPPDSPLTRNEGPRQDHIATLRAAQATLLQRHRDPGHPECVAIERAIAHIEGRPAF